MQASQSETQDTRVEDYIRILLWSKWFITAIVVGVVSDLLAPGIQTL